MALKHPGFGPSVNVAQVRVSTLVNHSGLSPCLTGGAGMGCTEDSSGQGETKAAERPLPTNTAVLQSLSHV